MIAAEHGLTRMRVDVVGSYLRPAALKDAFARFDRGEGGADELRALQDAAIRDLVAVEDRHGLPVVSDGEFRRRQFGESFADVTGTDQLGARIAQDATARTRATGLEVKTRREYGVSSRRPITEKLRLLRNAPLDEYRFTAGLTATPVKMAIVGPDRLQQKFSAAESRAAYPCGTDEFLVDVVRVQREMIAGLSEAGCRYVQVDAPGYMAYVDDKSIAEMHELGEDPAAVMERSLRADNAILAGFPEMTFGIHLCRGNSNGQWVRQGTYDKIAERMFNTLAHERFLLEYDDERSGGFAPLRFVPKGKMVVLGLITTKTARAETVDDLRARIDEASRYIPLDQLAISPQCGFASNMGGNPIDDDVQWRKMDVMMRTAEAIWGKR